MLSVKEILFRRRNKGDKFVQSGTLEQKWFRKHQSVECCRNLDFLLKKKVMVCYQMQWISFYGLPSSRSLPKSSTDCLEILLNIGSQNMYFFFWVLRHSGMRQPGRIIMKFSCYQNHFLVIKAFCFIFFLCFSIQKIHPLTHISEDSLNININTP